jgi:hypothetical protein
VLRLFLDSLCNYVSNFYLVCEIIDVYGFILRNKIEIYYLVLFFLRLSLCVYVVSVYANTYFSKTRPSSDYTLEQEVHTTTGICHVHSLRNRMSVAHMQVNSARANMEQLKATPVWL